MYSRNIRCWFVRRWCSHQSWALREFDFRHPTSYKTMSGKAGPYKSITIKMMTSMNVTWTLMIWWRLVAPLASKQVNTDSKYTRLGLATHRSRMLHFTHYESPSMNTQRHALFKNERKRFMPEYIHFLKHCLKVWSTSEVQLWFTSEFGSEL